MKKQLKKNKHKAFIEKALCLLAFFVLALCRTLVRRRMQERKIYLPFSKSPSVSRLSRHARGRKLFQKLSPPQSYYILVAAAGNEKESDDDEPDPVVIEDRAKTVVIHKNILLR